LCSTAIYVTFSRLKGGLDIIPSLSSPRLAKEGDDDFLKFVSLIKKIYHMAITSSAKKAIRNSARKRVFNVRRLGEMRGVIKDMKKLIVEKKKDEATALLPKAYKAIDKTAKRGIIKQNTASRKKSRLVAAINKVA
jgi:small subunit ribosomal protein S20